MERRTRTKGIKDGRKDRTTGGVEKDRKRKRWKNGSEEGKTEGWNGAKKERRKEEKGPQGETERKLPWDRLRARLESQHEDRDTISLHARD